MSLAGRIVNRSYTTIGAEPLIDATGADALAVVAKLSLSFDLAGRVTLAARPIRERDEPDDDGGVSLPSDIACDKPGTDLALVGTLTSPPRDVESVVVSIRMGHLFKAIRVFGERTYVADGGDVVPGRARPLTPLPIRPAAAWGGRDDTDRPMTFAPENPVGRGFARDPRRLVGKPAHRLEAASATERPAPQAFFAPIPASWEPRVTRAGTFDETWRRRRAPVPPLDRDPRAACWASADLHSDSPLSGDEAIEIAGLSARPFRLALPRYGVRMISRTNGRERELTTHLDGVVVDWDERVVELVWRASVPLPRTWEQLERVVVEATRSLPDAVLEPAPAGAEEVAS